MRLAPGPQPVRALPPLVRPIGGEGAWVAPAGGICWRAPGLTSPHSSHAQPAASLPPTMAFTASSSSQSQSRIQNPQSRIHSHTHHTQRLTPEIQTGTHNGFTFTITLLSSSPLLPRLMTNCANIQRRIKKGNKYLASLVIEVGLGGGTNFFWVYHRSYSSNGKPVQLCHTNVLL